MSTSTEPHPTQADCVDDEAFIGNIVEEEAFDELYVQTVECPECGRKYDYVYEREGVYDTHVGEYVSWSEAAKAQAELAEQFGAAPLHEEIEDPVDADALTFDEAEAYTSGQTYNVPTEDGRYEQVYILDRLQDAAGDTLHSF